MRIGGIHESPARWSQSCDGRRGSSPAIVSLVFPRAITIILLFRIAVTAHALLPPFACNKPLSCARAKVLSLPNDTSVALDDVSAAYNVLLTNVEDCEDSAILSALLGDAVDIDSFADLLSAELDDLNSESLNELADDVSLRGPRGGGQGTTRIGGLGVSKSRLYGLQSVILLGSRGCLWCADFCYCMVYS